MSCDNRVENIHVAQMTWSVLTSAEARAEAFDRAIDAVASIVSKGAQKHPLTDAMYKLFSVSEASRQVHEFMRNYDEDVARITMQGNQLARWLRDTLTDEESVAITRALGGDMPKDQLPKHLVSTYETLRKKIDHNADLLVKYGALDEKNKIDDYLKRYYAKYLEERSLFGGFSLRFQRLYARKDLSHEDRLALGMLENADFVVTNTLVEQRKQLYKAKMLQAMADAIAVDEEKPGYVRVPDDSVGGGVKRWGALAGKYVPEAFYQAMTDAQVVKETGRAAHLLKTWMGIIDHIKVNVTVKNPGTHLYNVLSNIQLAFLRGDLGALSEVIVMAATNRDKFAKLVNYAKKLGLNAEIEDFEGIARALTPSETKRSTSNVLFTLFKNLYMAEDTPTGKAIRKAYAWEDEIFKLAAFYKSIKGKTVNTKTARNLMREAMADYVDYRTPLPTFVRTLDKIGVMPFTHYVWKSTPRVARLIVKHPYKFMLLQLALYEMGASMFGDDDHLQKPDWASDKFNLFGAKQWVHLGDDLWLNLGRALPGIRWGKLEFDGGFVGGIFTILQGKDPLWGSKFVNEHDTSAQIWFKVAQKMAENYAPPLTFGRYAQRGLRKATGFHPPKNAYGKELSWKEYYLRPLGVREFNSKKEIEKHLRDVVKRWRYGDINDDEMHTEIQRVLSYAKKHSINVDRKKFNAYMKRMIKKGKVQFSHWWL